MRNLVDRSQKDENSVSGTMNIGSPYSGDSKSVQYFGSIITNEYGGYVLMLNHREVKERGENPYQHCSIPLNGKGRSKLMKKLERTLYAKYHEQTHTPTVREIRREEEKVKQELAREQRRRENESEKRLNGYRNPFGW
jgi:hypothetical protein